MPAMPAQMRNKIYVSCRRRGRCIIDDCGGGNYWLKSTRKAILALKMFVQRATLERKRNAVKLTMRPKLPPRCIYDQLVTRDHEWYLVASCDFVR